MKTRLVLKTNSELEDKTGTMRAKVVAAAMDGVDQGLMDTKETQQDLKVFTDYDEKQRKKHKLD